MQPAKAEYGMAMEQQRRELFNETMGRQTSTEIMIFIGIYRTRTNKGRSRTVAAPKELPKIGAFFLIFCNHIY